MKIRLNAQGKLLGYFDIPAYNPYPDVVTLGTRVFKMRTKVIEFCGEAGIRPVEPPPQDDCQLLYDECFCYHITTEGVG